MIAQFPAVAIGVFILAIVTMSGNPGIDSSQNVLYWLFVLQLVQALLFTVFGFCAAALIWLLFYLPCNLLMPPTSVLMVSLGMRAYRGARWRGGVLDGIAHRYLGTRFKRRALDPKRSAARQ